MIGKLLCYLGYHDFGYRCSETGIFLYTDCEHSENGEECICWRCKAYFIDGKKIRDNFYENETTKNRHLNKK